MSHTDFKNRIDALMNILWSGGVASHSTIIEQINFLVFLRSVSKKDDSAMRLDPDAERIFQGELSQYHWDNLLVLNAEVLFITLEEVYRRLPEVTTDKTIQLLYRDAHVKVFDKPTLRRIVHEIEQMMRELEEEAATGHNDIFGDMYEYLLGKLAQAGTLGSFRTPRHIIKFIIDVVDPSKGETILDPACGTAGFLVAALEHLKDKYSSEEFKKEDKHPLDLLSPEERRFLFQHTFTGFDSDFDMFKFGLMNLYLHQLEHPNIKRLNTLVDTAGDRTKWDVMLANPPFSGAVDKSSIAEDLQMGTRATEVLFLRYMLNHLSPNGRIGVVVPEGIIFQSGRAHSELRRMLLSSGIYAVISLPVGVFNPYTKTTKTSLLFIDKSLSMQVNSVLFIKVENDGFDLGSERKPIQKNDLPAAQKLLKYFKDHHQIPNDASLQAQVVSVEELEKRPHYNLALLQDLGVLEDNWQVSTSLDEILTPKKIPCKVSDVQEYKQVTVKMNGKGVVLRKVISGSEIKTKSQYLTNAGDFILSKIDARNGAFGIVPPDLEGALVTQDFPVFTINTTVVLPDFLKVLMKTPQFIEICSKSSVGTSNRKRINITSFLSRRIPLPSVSSQAEILERLKRIELKIATLQNKLQELTDEYAIQIENVWET